jgi:Tfp pilus assembly protein PilE
MMKKNKLKNIAGITLIEIMIGVVISAIMMGAMYTTYSLVNNSYSQVTDRAKISRSGRDIIAMLMRDIRLAGFKYYYGENATDIPKQDNLQYNSGNSDIEKSHDPIIVIKDDLSDATESDTAISKNDEADKCCDKIHIVYGDFNQNDEQPYKRYRVTYYAKPSGESEYYAVYKSKQSWIQSSDDSTGDWSSSCTECFSGELIRDL